MLVRPAGLFAGRRVVAGSASEGRLPPFLLEMREVMEGRFEEQGGSLWRPASQRSGPWELLVLVAEPVLADLKQVVTFLVSLGQPVRVATSSWDARDLLRRQIFTRAIVAAEMTFDGGPLIARVAAMPTLERIVATGPTGDRHLEVRARLAGAHVYLVRPVIAEALALALATTSGFADTR